MKLFHHSLLVPIFIANTLLGSVSATCRMDLAGCSVSILFPSLPAEEVNGTEYSSIALAQGMAIHFAAGCSASSTFPYVTAPRYRDSIPIHYNLVNDSATQDFNKAYFDSIHDETNKNHLISYARNRAVGHIAANAIQRRQENRGVGVQRRKNARGGGNNGRSGSNSQGNRRLGCDWNACCAVCRDSCFHFGCGNAMCYDECDRRNLRSNKSAEAKLDSSSTIDIENDESRNRELLSYTKEEDQCKLDPITVSTVFTELIHHHAFPHGRPECAMFQDYIMQLSDKIYRIIVDDISGQQIAIIELGIWPGFDLISYTNAAFGEFASNYRLSYGPSW